MTIAGKAFSYTDLRTQGQWEESAGPGTRCKVAGLVLTKVYTNWRKSPSSFQLEKNNHFPM